ncbi:hypothetical protein Pan241w_20630 [Gimesia alba]|uniref:Uncharacterized protein n=1 Tax=Gimesia alba TaxID=2527973 RepID=A0A517RDQ2_9PLAN|nr:hypothetical protein Pan241w_20630 [Gimesia alba]
MQELFQCLNDLRAVLTGPLILKFIGKSQRPTPICVENAATGGELSTMASAGLKT